MSNGSANYFVIKGSINLCMFPFGNQTTVWHEQGFRDYVIDVSNISWHDTFRTLSVRSSFSVWDKQVQYVLSLADTIRFKADRYFSLQECYSSFAIHVYILENIYIRWEI